MEVENPSNTQNGHQYGYDDGEDQSYYSSIIPVNSSVNRNFMSEYQEFIEEEQAEEQKREEERRKKRQEERKRQERERIARKEQEKAENEESMQTEDTKLQGDDSDSSDANSWFQEGDVVEEGKKKIESSQENPKNEKNEENQKNENQAQYNGESYQEWRRRMQREKRQNRNKERTRDDDDWSHSKFEANERKERRKKREKDFRMVKPVYGSTNEYYSLYEMLVKAEADEDRKLNRQKTRENVKVFFKPRRDGKGIRGWVNYPGTRDFDSSYFVANILRLVAWDNRKQFEAKFEGICIFVENGKMMKD